MERLRQFPYVIVRWTATCANGTAATARLAQLHGAGNTLDELDALAYGCPWHDPLTERIRALNDAFRRTLTGERLRVTRGVMATARCRASSPPNASPKGCIHAGYVLCKIRSAQRPDRVDGEPGVPPASARLAPRTGGARAPAANRQSVTRSCGPVGSGMQRLVPGKYVPLVVATLIGVIIVAQALALQRSYQATWLLAVRSAENVLNTIATTIGRNLSVIDLSLRGAEEAVATSGVSELPPDVRQKVLFDRAASAQFLGSMLVLNREGTIMGF